MTEGVREAKPGAIASRTSFLHLGVEGDILMSYRHLALAIVTLTCTTTATAQSARITGPTRTAITMAPTQAAAPGITHTARGYDAMHRLARKPNVTGGIIGFVVGAAVGATVGCLANKDDYGVFCAGQSDTKVVVGALVGGAAGAAIGGLLFKRK